MRKILALILSTVIVFSSLGFTMSSHYCGGKRVDSALSLGNAAVTCGMQEVPGMIGVGSEVKSNCCENKYQKLQIEDEYTPSFVKIDFAAIIAIPELVLSQGKAYTSCFKVRFFRGHSPPLIVRNLVVLIQSFRI